MQIFNTSVTFGKKMQFKNKNGFSLIEVLVLIVVLGIVASTAMQWMTSSIDDIRKVKTSGFKYAIQFDPNTIRIYRQPLRIAPLLQALDIDLQEEGMVNKLPMKYIGAINRMMTLHGYA